MAGRLETGSSHQQYVASPKLEVPNMTIKVDIEHLHKINSFASQLNLTVWADRDKSWPRETKELDQMPEQVAAKQSNQPNQPNQLGDASGTSQISASIGQSAVAMQMPDKQTKQVETDADTNKKPVHSPESTTKSQPATSVDNAPNNVPGNVTLKAHVSLRLGALPYMPNGKVLVLYSLMNKVGISQGERELLNRMLDKCGVDIEEYRYIKENILVYPPPIKNIEAILSNDQNVLQNIITGFITALRDKYIHKLEGSAGSTQQKWHIVILGEDVAKHFPKHRPFMSNAPIVIDSLKEMLDNPQRRKIAWELLAPLRQSLQEHNVN